MKRKTRWKWRRIRRRVMRFITSPTSIRVANVLVIVIVVVQEEPYFPLHNVDIYIKCSLCSKVADGASFHA